MYISNSRIRINIILLLITSIVLYVIYSMSNDLPSAQVKEKAVKKDDTTCKQDAVLRNVDPNHTNAHISFWKHLSQETADVYKSRWQHFISNLKKQTIPSFKGKGIVLVAGNKDTFRRALTTIQLLRGYSCRLGIEVWHLNDEQPTTEMKQQLKSLNAVPRDLSDTSLVRPIINRRDADKQ